MLYSDILNLARQSGGDGPSPWFKEQLEEQIEEGMFLAEKDLEAVLEDICRDLSDYRDQAGVGTAVLGMSGGVDSALTAAVQKGRLARHRVHLADPPKCRRNRTGHRGMRGPWRRTQPSGPKQSV